MTWVILLLILTIFMIAGLGLGLFALYENLSNTYLALEKSIQDAHAQVINNEKITRIVLENAQDGFDKMKNMSDNNTDIHRVCVMIAQEIQAAKEAQKRA